MDTSVLKASAAIRAALRGHDPSPEQWAAIAHPLEPVHLIAGAGSGKTAIMAARIVWIVENHGYRPDQVLGLTFTNKATEELQARVRAALNEIDPVHSADATISTYHAFASQVVREHGLLADVEPEAGLLSEAQQWQLILGCLDDLPAFEAYEIRSSYIVRDAIALASAIADHSIDISDVQAASEAHMARFKTDEDVIKTATKRLELCRVVDSYTRLKRSRGKIDYGDQITKAVQLLRDHADIRATYQERHPILLLDEYQDTNVAQRKMIELLVVPGGCITAVGDTRQAIYAWRGATMYNLIGFPGHFPRNGQIGYDPVPLSKNFRSGSRILSAANVVVEQIAAERRPGPPLEASANNLDGEVSLGLFSTDRAEAEWIADQIESLHEQVLLEGRDPVAWKDIAILVRRRSTMDPIITALEARDIPVEIVGLAGLLKAPEVIEVVAWLRCLETKPRANRWMARVLLGPRWRIHYRDLALCARWAALRNRDYIMRLAEGDEEIAADMTPGDVGYSLAEALNHLDEIEGLGEVAKARLRAFSERLESLRSRTSAPLLELVQAVISTSGIGDALQSSSSRYAPAARQNLSNFLDQVAAFSPVEGEASLRSLLDYLDAADSAEETLEATQPAEADSVKLMTVHAAKGLEFECVFVPSVAAKQGKYGFTYSVFPSTRTSDPLRNATDLPYDVREDREHLPSWEDVKPKEFTERVRERVLEDERRLFYVALTRAKQRLAVTAAWWVGRDVTEKGPSQFWCELEPLAEDGIVNIVRKDEFPADNPTFEELDVTWPPPPRAAIEDPLWPGGFGSIADDLVGGHKTVDDLAAALDAPARQELQEAIAEAKQSIDMIAAAAVPAEEPAIQLPDILSATSLVSYEKGQLDAWDLARPLPSRPTPQRRLGTEVHRLIEEKTRGVAAWAEETELDDPDPLASKPGMAAELMKAFEESGYADRTPATLPSGEPMIEMPFAIAVDGRIVRGRIDAVYETDDGGIEIVDYKTGARFEPGPSDQLSLYAEALFRNRLIPKGTPVTLTYVWLDGSEPTSRAWLRP